MKEFVIVVRELWFVLLLIGIMFFLMFKVADLPQKKDYKSLCLTDDNMTGTTCSNILLREIYKSLKTNN